MFSSAFPCQFSSFLNGAENDTWKKMFENSNCFDAQRRWGNNSVLFIDSLPCPQNGTCILRGKTLCQLKGQFPIGDATMNDRNRRTSLYSPHLSTNLMKGTNWRVCLTRTTRLMLIYFEAREMVEETLISLRFNSPDHVLDMGGQI